MNSIACMKPSKALTEEAREIKRAFDESGLTKAAIATHNHVSPGMAYQWIEGLRPISRKRAERIAKQLGTDPRKISREYAEANPAGENAPLTSNENLEALEYAVMSLVASMIPHRPIEAAEVRASLLREAPRRLQEQGLVHELLVTLAEVGRPTR
jgi:transcriptional regulator with XRE-family HTH domain